MSDLQHARGSRRSPIAVQVGAFLKTLGISASTALGDSRIMVADAGLRIVRVIVLLTLWRAIIPADAVVDGFTLATLLTYTLAAELFAEQLDCTSEFGSWLWEGVIANKLVHPVNLIGQLVSIMAGRWVFGFLAVSLPVVLLAPLIGVNPLPTSGGALLLFVPSLVMSIAIGLAMDFILGILVVAYDLTLWLINWLRSAVAVLLAGTLIPLAILPWNLGQVFQWLPFASMGSAPLLIYTGVGSVVRLLAIQLGWAVLLWGAARWLWLTTRERLVSFGG